MSDATPSLALPLLVAAQAQKHVTHNDALLALDAIVMLCVLDRHRSEPPASPADGSRHLVAAAPAGAWAGHAGHVAAWQDGAWRFYIPKEGWMAWVAGEELLLCRGASGWVEALRFDRNAGRAAFSGAVTVESRARASLPSAAARGAGAILYVSDERGGPTLAFSDGTAWRRVADRAVVG